MSESLPHGSRLKRRRPLPDGSWLGSWSSALTLAVVIIATLVAGCNNQQKQATDGETLMSGVEQGFGASQLSVQQIQSQVMGFADTFANRYAQAANELERSLEEPSRRAGIHSAKISNVLSAYSIAASQSAIVSLLDMVVFITLQRIIYEEVWQFRLPIGAAGDQMLIAMHASEKEIWEIAEMVLTEDQQTELHNMILRWRAENPTQNYVSRIRFSEFGSLRTTADTEETANRRRSLFSLLALDPLSSLEPSERELRATRLSAERLAYFAKRLPVVLAWYPKQAAYDITATPEIHTLLTNIDEYGDSAEALMAEVQSWPDVIAAEREAIVASTNELVVTASETMANDLVAALSTEREAAVEQLLEKVRVEREATIEQIHQSLRTEREAMQSWIDSEHVELASLLNELKLTLDSGDALAESSNALLETYALLNPPRPEGAEPRSTPPTTVADYENVLRQAEATARELRQLSDSIRGVLETESETGQENAIANTLTIAQTGARSVVDRAFLYALILLAILLIGLPISLTIAARLRRT